MSNRTIVIMVREVPKIPAVFWAELHKSFAEMEESCRPSSAVNGFLNKRFHFKICNECYGEDRSWRAGSDFSTLSLVNTSGSLNLSLLDILWYQLMYQINNNDFSGGKLKTAFTAVIWVIYK